MPSYKLLYLNGRGRAEVTRMMFALKGIEYEDKRISFEEFGKMRQELPQGHVPVLYVDTDDDKKYVICQSLCIARYVARELDLCGKSNIEHAQAEIPMDTSEELRQIYYKALFEQDESKKAELMKSINEETLPKYLSIFDKLLGGNAYFVGDSVTVADLAVYDILESFYEENPALLDSHKKLKANRSSVAEKLKEYLAKREPTPF